SLNNSNISNPLAKPTSVTQYTVTGTDAAGCVNTDTITVYITHINKGNYLIPNAFTPNHDGVNDCFGIKFWGILMEVDFSIYNRWGERIFHTTKPGECWDGTYKRQLQKPDVYIYIIKAKTTCENYIFRKGIIALIK